MPWSALNSTGHANKRSESSQAFYTRPSIIDKCVHTIVHLPEIVPRPDETIIDFACGDNRFGAHLRVATHASLRSFDVEPARNAHAPETITKGDFLTTTPRDFSTIVDHCVLGLNPPFGFKSKRLRRFVEHAIVVARPRCIYLIHQRRLYRPAGYTTHYQNALPLRAFHLPNNNNNNEEGRIFPMYGCFFSVFIRAESGSERAAHNGMRELVGGLPSWLVSFSHMRDAEAGDTLALLRTGSRAGNICVLLDGVAARVRVIYDCGVRVPSLPSSVSINSNIYYKLRITPERLTEYAPVTVDQLARLLSLQGGNDRAKNDSFPPYITRAHVIRCLEHAFVKGSNISSKKRPRDPFDGDIRDYLNV